MEDMTNPTGPRLPSRRDFLALGAGAFVVATVPLARSRRSRRLVRRQVPMMGTIADVAVVHSDPRYAQGAIDAALEELALVERTMSRFRDDSDVGRANLGAAAAPVEVTERTAIVLAEALRWADVSDGAFDPCLARAVALWDVGSRTAPPPEAAYTLYAGRGLHRALELDRSGGHTRVLFHEADIGIDLGGIAKGYGVDRAVEALRSWGIHDALVNVGGDLHVLGVSEDGDAWKVGVRSPTNPSGLTTTVRLTDRAVATSGDYERFFDRDGRRFHHILDPATGEPRRSANHSVTVVADTCMTADAAATTVFGSPRPRAVALLAKAAPHTELLHLT